LRDDRQRLTDIQEALEKIDRYTALGKKRFFGDELVQVWVIHHLQMIGEAANGISQRTRERYPDIPWGKIIGLRNILVHHYFAIDAKEMWAVIELDIPPFRDVVHRILDEMPDS
jgi:uncharacterized protein with HEPN domain